MEMRYRNINQLHCGYSISIGTYYNVNVSTGFVYSCCWIASLFLLSFFLLDAV